MNANAMQSFEPVKGLIIFQRRHQFYLQLHEIEKTKEKKFIWKEGHPLMKEQLQELAMALRNENLSVLQCNGALPENVLYFQPDISGNKFAWYLPPSEHTLNFSSGMKIKSGKYKLPGIIFCVNKTTLSVFVYKGNKRPDNKTELFNAPFFNVYLSGEVCMGTTSETKKKAFLQDEIDRHQRRFFGSKFTGAHGDSERKLAPGFKLQDIYTTLRAGKPFPEKCLKLSHKRTIQSLLKSFTNKNNPHAEIDIEDHI